MTDPAARQDQKGPGAFVPPDADATPQAQADELFVHGALTTLHERDGMEARLSRLSESLHRTDREPGRRLVPGSLRRVSGIAVVLCAVVLASFVFVSVSTNQARATLMASIQASKSLGERRYEVRILSEFDQPVPAKPEAVFDSNGPDFLLRVRAPGGRTVHAGKDHAGEWAVRRQGGIERVEPRRAWPRWATADDEPIFADSIDRMLEVLISGFDLKILEPETVNGRLLHRVEGIKRGNASRGLADRVNLWIDPDSMLVQKMEMDWTKRPGIRAPAGAPLPPPPGGRERPGEPQAGGAHPNGQQAHGPRPDADMTRPPGLPPRHRLPPGEQGMRPPPDGGPGEAMPGKPRPGGIRRLILTRVDAPQWPENWFSPEAHQDGAWGEP